jgi:hypothetical protein
MQFYRRNLPHLQTDFKPHFITFVTKFRWALPDWARDIALSRCHDHRRQYELYVAVVMPDHVHMILTPLTDQRGRQTFSLIDIMRGIRAPPLGGLISKWDDRGRCGKRSRLIMCCAARMGWMRRLSMFFRIPSERGWSTAGGNIVGHGGGVGRTRRG